MLKLRVQGGGEDDMNAVASSTRVAIENILCAIDLSSQSEKILELAAAVGNSYGSTIHVAHIVPSLDYTLAPLTGMRAQQEIESNAKQQVANLIANSPIAALPHKVVIEDGDVADVLLEFIQRQAIDLVVLGTHGRHGLSRLALGSVAEEIFRQVACPVLSIGPKAHAGADFSLHRILFATDLSAESRSALPYALSLAQEYQAKLTLLHLIHPAIQAPAERQRIGAQYKAQLKCLVPEEVESWCDVDFVVGFDHRAEGIVRMAAAIRAEMIVLGVRGTGLFTDIATRLPGPTAYEVVAGAPCPVLTVRAG